MTYPQCAELVCVESFTTFEGRSRRAFVTGQQVWVTSSAESQARLGIAAIAKKGKNAGSAKYFKMEDIDKYFRPS